MKFRVGKMWQEFGERKGKVEQLIQERVKLWQEVGRAEKD